jgi:hypothetical protein
MCKRCPQRQAALTSPRPAETAAREQTVHLAHAQQLYCPTANTGHWCNRCPLLTSPPSSRNCSARAEKQHRHGCTGHMHDRYTFTCVKHKAHVQEVSSMSSCSSAEITILRLPADKPASSNPISPLQPTQVRAARARGGVITALSCADRPSSSSDCSATSDAPCRHARTWHMDHRDHVRLCC